MAARRWKGDQFEVQLVITNHGDKDVLFPTFDTFSVGLKWLIQWNARCICAQDGNGVEQSRCSFPPGKLLPLQERFNYVGAGSHKQLFMYFDGTGTVAAAGPVKGDYTLKFYVGSPQKQLCRDHE